MRFSFRKQQRVVKRSEFARAIHDGGCAADDTLVLFAYPTAPEQPPRLGVTIPKKTGGAVARNRWKRLIRESFRTQPERFPPGYDFVVRPKKGGVANWAKIREGLPRLAVKAISRVR